MADLEKDEEGENLAYFRKGKVRMRISKKTKVSVTLDEAGELGHNLTIEVKEFRINLPKMCYIGCGLF